MKCFISVLCILSAGEVMAFDSGAREAVLETKLAPVSRRLLTCDQWQWIGNGAVTWGCLRTPREAIVAGGAATDEAIAHLLQRIEALEAKVRQLEGDQSRAFLSR